MKNNSSKIKMESDDCEDCEICKLMKKGEHNYGDLMEAFAKQNRINENRFKKDKK
ncbi:MAG TPA: hypothetical protein VJB95_00810 [Candidatus Paceibacterota bacterium]